MTDKTPTETGQAPAPVHQGPMYAERLVELGCHVHPLKPGSKAPATESGLKDAVQDASAITGNYGVVAGRSGLVIVDLDDYVPGNSVEEFIRDFELEPTFEVRTGSGGRSWWYLQPEGVSFRSAQNFAGYTGVDIKAGESYALGPGCELHPDNIKAGSVGDGHYVFNIYGPKEFEPLPIKLTSKLLEASRPKVAPTRPAEHQAYDAMSESVRARIDTWMQRALKGIFDELEEMKTFGDGEYPKGYGWQEGVLERTGRLASLVMADWNPYSDENAKADLLDHLPRDAGFPIATGMGMYLRAFTSGNIEPAKMPFDPDEGDWMFEDVPDRSSSSKNEPDEPPNKPSYELEGGPADAAWLLAELGTKRLSGFFLRGGELVYTARIDDDEYIPPPGQSDLNGPATVQAANWEKIAAKVDLYYDIYKWKTTEDGKKFARAEYFPDIAAKRAFRNVDVSANLRQLYGVTHTPIIRADGSILSRPGYDQATGLLYMPTVEVEIPSDEHILAAVPAARDRIRSMISEFTWAGKDDEANYIGLLLTPLIRELTPPPYKLVAIGAHQPGSGKGLLARIMRDVHGGVFRADLPPTEEEMGKSIAGILTQTTAPVVQFDNIDKKLKSTILTALLTSATYSGRILGSTNSVEMRNDRLWVVTGNNLSFGGDLTRRTIPIIIDPKHPNPEERTGFKLNIPEYVAATRGEILADLLVLIRGWILAGSPTGDATTSDDYAHWVTTVRGILEHAGIPGRFDGTKITRSNEDEAEWAGFLTVAHELMGDGEWRIADLMAKGDDSVETYRRILESLPEREYRLALRDSLRGVSKTLGRLAGAMEGRHVDGYVLKSVGAFRGTKIWTVQQYQK